MGIWEDLEGEREGERKEGREGGERRNTVIKL